jgi:hypothetical protein
MAYDWNKNELSDEVEIEIYEMLSMGLPLKDVLTLNGCSMIEFNERQVKNPVFKRHIAKAESQFHWNLWREFVSYSKENPGKAMELLRIKFPDVYIAVSSKGTVSSAEDFLSIVAARAEEKGIIL